MTMTTAPGTATDRSPVGATPAPVGALPRVEGVGEAAAMLEALSTASKRGRLPGFKPGPPGAFRVAAFGTPFEGHVTAVHGPEGGGTLRFSVDLDRKLPAFFLVTLIATVWPGVLLVDSLIPGEWGWIPTWWWYVPLTVLPIPFAWRAAMSRSRVSAREHAAEMIAKIAAETNGRVVSEPGKMTAV